LMLGVCLLWCQEILCFGINYDLQFLWKSSIKTMWYS
jgi:hypothetical protein